MVLTIAVLLFPVSQHGDSAYAYNFPIVLFTLQVYVKLLLYVPPYFNKKAQAYIDLMKDHDVAFID